MRDTPSDWLSGAVAHMQVVVRARQMGLISRSALRAWQSGSSVAALSRETEPEPSGEVEFKGDKASDLNPLLSGSSGQTVRVTSKSLTADQAIVISRSGIHLDLGRTVIRGNSDLPYLVRIENTKNITVHGGIFTGGDTGFLVNRSQSVRISGATIRDLGGAGVVVTNSKVIVVRGNHISGLKYAGVMLHRAVTGSLIEENRIENNRGTSGLASAILLTDREVDIAADSRAIFGSDFYHAVQQPLATRRHPPSGNLIRANELFQNHASGVYSDGGIRNVIASNVIAGNAKEGICLHDGSMANVVTANVVRRNGGRWGEPDAALRTETSAPGISLENTLYNIVYNNSVTDNYGGGIKMVRSSLFNVIGMNSVLDNARGGSAEVHFFGIELGAAPADTATAEPDISPSRGNIVFSNMIRGVHYSGVFLDEGSDQNELNDNLVMDATRWALESAAPMPNITLNNLTNLPSRNISSGLDPNLLIIGLPVMDTASAKH